MSDLELSKLEYFRIVAQTEHVTRAARLLSLSQPALSRSLASLEQELGIPLFDRRGRNLFLNVYGKEFLEYVEKALQLIDEGQRVLQVRAGLSSVSVALAFLPTLGPEYVPQLIRGFNKKYQDVQFHLWQNTNDTIIQQLESGNVDLGLCSSPKNHLNLSWNQLFSEELFVIVPSSHRLASARYVELTEIADESFIALKRGTGLRSVTENLFRESGFSPRITFESEEVSTIAGLVGAGLGVSLLPKWIGSDSSATRLLRVREPVCQRIIGIASVKGRVLPLAARRFQEYANDIAASNVDWNTS